MTTLEAIRHITQHPEYKKVVIMDETSATEGEESGLTSLQAISYFTYDDLLSNWRLSGSLEKETLIIHRV